MSAYQRVKERTERALAQLRSYGHRIPNDPGVTTAQAMFPNLKSSAHWSAEERAKDEKRKREGR